ncbi:hypothetical protein [Oligoflexus tunisiensis]|uniref:hypothetical protein n=1 Tax=Oligoflexus tunisiensis TaxID=708132 RepID=UPI00114C9A8C|nr:hypothetical protein [Oligoflexus tunisiensis]
MKYEQHDNLILADWTYSGSPLSRAVDETLTVFEKLMERVYQTAAKSHLDAVIWIQKVPVHDFHTNWLEEVNSSLQRDELRWRLRRWYRLRQNIQFSPVPWFYVTEHGCQGTFFEMMLVCQRRFVFNRDVWFGFPEMAIGSMPPLGWVAGQLNKRPRILEQWQKRPLMRAEEVVQHGYVDAALTWKDWRLQLLPWAARQIESWNQEQPQRGKVQMMQDHAAVMWTDKAIRDPARTPTLIHVNAPKMRETPSTTDYALLDTAAHFYCQPQYEAFLQRHIRQFKTWGEPPHYELVYLDLNEALPPLSLLTRLLDSGYRLCFIAASSEVLRQGLEVLFPQLDTYYRRGVLQQFERQLAWYVGETPREPQYPTLAFGAFRNFQFNLRDLRIRGWALAAQSVPRQTAEISDDHASRGNLLRTFFDGIHSIASPHKPRPALYYVKSLALQALASYAEQSGEALPVILEQLRNLGWHLMGSERHWQRFIEYRSGIQGRVPVQEPDAVGNLGLDRKLLLAPHWRAVCEMTAARSLRENGQRGPGLLQSYLVGFCTQLAQALVQSSCLPTLGLAQLYVADALGFPENWGSADIFETRTGVARPYFKNRDSTRSYR